MIIISNLFAIHCQKTVFPFYLNFVIFQMPLMGILWHAFMIKNYQQSFIRSTISSFIVWTTSFEILICFNLQVRYPPLDGVGLGQGVGEAGQVHPPGQLLQGERLAICIWQKIRLLPLPATSYSSFGGLCTEFLLSPTFVNTRIPRS